MATDPINQANNENEKVTFTEAQQARVNALIQEAQGRAARETKEQLTAVSAKVETLQTELDAAKLKATTGTRKERQEASEDVEALRAEIAEVKNAAALKDQEVERMRQQLGEKSREAATFKGEALDIRKQSAILQSASQTNFIDVSMVSKLTADQVKYDEVRGKFIVVNEQGTERMNSAFEPMSLEEFYAEFGNKHPYLVRGESKGGAGSSESQRSGLSVVGQYQPEQIFGNKSSSVLAAKLYKENPKEYARLKHVAREAGLVAA